MKRETQITDAIDNVASSIAGEEALAAAIYVKLITRWASKQSTCLESAIGRWAGKQPLELATKARLAARAFFAPEPAPKARGGVGARSPRSSSE